MRMSSFDRRLFRIALLAVVAAASYWLCSARVETSTRHSLLSPADERPPMFVLQVGIGKYINAPVWAELRGAVTDVVEMRKVLESERWGVPSANIVTLTDEQGTKPLIFEKFRTHLIANAKKHHENVKDRRKGAVVMFQFSGHGSQVRDTDGDERDDGKDETLVTHDSQDVEGKNFDITDDEIYALTRELREWTDNIVYVLDSCHSGSGTRDSQDVRRLPERRTLPVQVAGVGVTTRSGEQKKDSDGDSGVLPPGNDYIVITAARPDELASQKNCFEECGATKRPVVFGNLTFYLIDELRNARADTSYRELMENVTRRVTAEKPTQTPQLEGDRSRFVFSGLGRREDNFVRLAAGEAKLPNGDRLVRLRTGAMQGVMTGSIVSFYDKSVSRFDGAEKISSGVVTSVDPAESSVKLVGARREITIEDRAVIVAPDLGAFKLKVDLDVDRNKFAAAEKRMIDLARAEMARDVAIRLMPAGALADDWDIALLKDKFAAVVAKIPGARSDAFACAQPRPGDPDAAGAAGGRDRDVFYLAGRDYRPMFRFCMEAALESEEAAAARVRTAIVHIAALRSINAIANTRSALNGKITVQPIRLGGTMRCVNSLFTVDSYKPSVPDPKTGAHPFGPREMFWFEVTNGSSVPLYAALLNVDPSGAVQVLSPRTIFEESDGVVIPPGGKRIIVGNDCKGTGEDIEDAAVLFASRTAGNDRFKFIFSTQQLVHAAFANLQRPPLGSSREGFGSLAGRHDWTTVETIFEINDTMNQ